MKPFNLAESRIAQRTYCQTHLNRRIKIIAVLSSVAVVMAVLAYTCNTVITRRADKATDGLVKIDERCASIRQQTESVKAELDQRKWQDQLSRTSDSWLGVIDGTLGSLPEEVWVTRIETSPKDSTLLIEGRAGTYDSLSAFMDALRKNPAFSEVRLGTVRIARIGTMACVDFTVPIKLKPKTSDGDSNTTAQNDAPTTGRPGA